MEKRKFSLLILGFSCLIIFNIILGITSFMWFEGLIINGVLMIIFTLFPIIAIVNYKNKRPRRVKLVLVVFSMFWISYFSQRLVKTQIEKSTQKKGELLVEKLEEYKELNNKYPRNLNSEEFQNINLDYFLNSKIQYKYRNDTSYIVQFPTFNQSNRIYGNKGNWFYDD